MSDVCGVTGEDGRCWLFRKLEQALSLGQIPLSFILFLSLTCFLHLSSQIQVIFPHQENEQQDRTAVL